jgi:hypothetical protein
MGLRSIEISHNVLGQEEPDCEIPQQSIETGTHSIFVREYRYEFDSKFVHASVSQIYAAAADKSIEELQITGVNTSLEYAFLHQRGPKTVNGFHKSDCGKCFGTGGLEQFVAVYLVFCNVLERKKMDVFGQEVLCTRQSLQSVDQELSEVINDGLRLVVEVLLGKHFGCHYVDHLEQVTRLSEEGFQLAIGVAWIYAKYTSAEGYVVTGRTER